MAISEPFPATDEFEETAFDPASGRRKGTGKFSRTFVQWFLGLGTTITAAAQVQPGAFQAQGLHASLALTPLNTNTLPAGLYRVTVFLRCGQKATVSSTLTATLTFTDQTIVSNIVGNTSASRLSLTNSNVGDVVADSFLIHIDANVPIQVSTTYVSNGATPLQYDLYAILETLGS